MKFMVNTEHKHKAFAFIAEEKQKMPKFVNIIVIKEVWLLPRQG